MMQKQARGGARGGARGKARSSKVREPPLSFFDNKLHVSWFDLAQNAVTAPPNSALWGAVEWTGVPPHRLVRVSPRSSRRSILVLRSFSTEEARAIIVVGGDGRGQGVVFASWCEGVVSLHKRVSSPGEFRKIDDQDMALIRAVFNTAFDLCVEGLGDILVRACAVKEGDPNSGLGGLCIVTEDYFGTPESLGDRVPLFPPGTRRALGWAPPSNSRFSSSLDLCARWRSGDGARVASVRTVAYDNPYAMGAPAMCVEVSVTDLPQSVYLWWANEAPGGGVAHRVAPLEKWGDEHCLELAPFVHAATMHTDVPGWTKLPAPAPAADFEVLPKPTRTWSSRVVRRCPVCESAAPQCAPQCQLQSFEPPPFHPCTPRVSKVNSLGQKIGAMIVIDRCKVGVQ